MATIEDCYEALEQNRAPFFIVFGFYVCWMLAIAFKSYDKNKKAEEGDAHYEQYYLGGKSYGSVLLFLTLFSTIFSGYTVVGVPGEAAALGYFAVRWLTSAPFVGLAVLVYSPRGRRLSVARNYLSPNDGVTDRFDNRILTSIISLITTVPQVLYIIAQFYTLKNLIPTLSGYGRDGLPLMDGNVTTWCLGIVIWVCEAVGGFDSVSMTDALQSVLMIVSLVLMPIVATHYYNGAGGSTEPNCESYELIACATDDNSFDIPGYCMRGCDATRTTISSEPPAAFQNGCLAHVAAGQLVLHPATGWSEYGTPYDDSEYFNFTAVNILSFNILFFAFFLNPHWVQRSFAAKTDDSLKKANMVMNFMGLIATLPGVFVGVMVAANLNNVYIEPSANGAFGTLLSDMMTKGGFAEFVAVLASCSAIAAIMSTADSAIIGITNVLTRDFFNNWLFVKYEWLNTPRFNAVSSKLISLAIVITSICVALYDCRLTPYDKYGNLRDACSADDASDGIYGDLISWQNALLWQALPTMTLSIFMERANAWALLIGLAVGLSMMGGMFDHYDTTDLFGTQNAEEDPKTFYLQVGGASLWPGFTNLLVSWFFSLIMGDADAPQILRHGDSVMQQFGNGERLQLAKIREIMEGTQEPLSTIPGRICMFLSVVFTCLPLPYYGDDYDGCDPVSFLTGVCDGNYTGGIPAWAFTAILCYICAMLTNFGAYLTWKTVDEEASALSGLTAEVVDPAETEKSVEMQGKVVGERTV